MNLGPSTSAVVRREAELAQEPLIVYRSRAMSELCAQAERVAAGHAKVLITGESGVGKDLLARFIHSRSPRALRAFIAVNCAALTETLLESELFGHVKGSFTGADREKLGKLRFCHGPLQLDGRTACGLPAFRV